MTACRARPSSCSPPLLGSTGRQAHAIARRVTPQVSPMLELVLVARRRTRWRLRLFPSRPAKRCHASLPDDLHLRCAHAGDAAAASWNGARTAAAAPALIEGHRSSTGACAVDRACRGPRAAALLGPAAVACRPRPADAPGDLAGSPPDRRRLSRSLSERRRGRTLTPPQKLLPAPPGPPNLALLRDVRRYRTETGCRRTTFRSIRFAGRGPPHVAHQHRLLAAGQPGGVRLWLSPRRQLLDRTCATLQSLEKMERFRGALI